MTRAASAYSRFLQRWSKWLVVLFAVALPFVGLGAWKALKSNQNDVKRWLPDAYPETKSLEWYQESFGMGSDAGVVIVWPDCRVSRVDAAPGEAADDQDAAPKIEVHPSIVRLTKLLETAKLDPDDPESPPLLVRIMSGAKALEEMTRQPAPENEDVLGLDYEEVELRLEGSILGPDYVHGILFDVEHPSPATILQVETETLAEENGLEPGEVVRSVNGIPTPDAASAKAALLRTYEQAASGTLVLELADGTKVQLDWQGPRPGRQTAIIATLSEPASRQENLERAVGRIKEIAAEAGISEDELHLGGPPVDNVAIDYEGRRTLVRLALLSFGVGLFLCYFCLNNVKLGLLVFFTSLFSEGTSLALVTWTGGYVDAILMSLPTLIYLLTISGSIHLANYYCDSLPEVGDRNAPAMAVIKGWMPCLLAAATTAAGMGSLMVSDLSPIRNFGFYSALAVMTTLMWIFLFVPAFLQWFPLKNKKVASVATVHEARWYLKPVTRMFSWSGDQIIRYHNWVMGFTFVTVVAFTIPIFGLHLKIGNTVIDVPGLKTTVKLMEMFSDDTRIVQDYKWIENRLSALVPMEVVISTDNSETIIVSGGPKGGAYVLSFDTPDGEFVETEPIPWNAAADVVEAALRDAGLKQALVRKRDMPNSLAHRVVMQEGGETPYFNVETQGELMEDHVRVRHAERLVHRMQLIEQARRAVQELPEVTTALATTTFAPRLPNSTNVFDPQTSLTDTAMNRSRPKLVESGFFAEQPGSDLLRISLRLGAFSPVDYSHFVADIRRAVDPIVYANILETNSEDINSGDRLLGWTITKQVRDEATGEAEFWYVHQVSNEENPAKPLEFVGYVHVAADGNVTAKIDNNTIYAGPGVELSAHTTYTGIVPLVYKAQNELMRSLYSSYFWGFTTIVAMVMPWLWKVASLWKSIPASLWVMLPNYYPTAIVFGLMGLLQVPLDVGIMMTASVALGMSLDDTVHYVAWYERGVKEFRMTRIQACRYAYKTCATAMFQSHFVAMLGMSVFMMSTFQPTMQFGLYMVPLIGVALIGDLLILPAMLASWVGWFFSPRGVEKGRFDDSPQEPLEATEPISTPTGSALGPSSRRRPAGAVGSRS